MLKFGAALATNMLIQRQSWNPQRPSWKAATEITEVDPITLCYFIHIEIYSIRYTCSVFKNIKNAWYVYSTSPGVDVSCGQRMERRRFSREIGSKQRLQLDPSRHFFSRSNFA